MTSLHNTPATDCQSVALEDLFQAYFDCRRSKRNTMNALAFETDYESNLIALYEELNTGTYLPLWSQSQSNVKYLQRIFETASCTTG